jgi:hypothetical protein
MKKNTEIALLKLFSVPPNSAIMMTNIIHQYSFLHQNTGHVRGPESNTLGESYDDILGKQGGNSLEGKRSIALWVKTEKEIVSWLGGGMNT